MNKTLIISILVCFVLISTSAFATDYIFTGAGDNTWCDEANWNDGGSGYPDGNDDTAYFNSTYNEACNMDCAVTVGNITFFNGYTQTLTQNANIIIDDAGAEAGTVTLDDGVFDTNGYDITADGDVSVYGILDGGTGSITARSIYIYDGGTYSATTGTTTLTGERSGSTFNLYNVGTFTHNDGTVEIDAIATTTGFGGNGLTFYNLVFTAVTMQYMSYDVIVENDLTISSGLVQSSLADDYVFNVAGDVTINGGTLNMNRNGVGNDLEFGSLTIGVGGTYSATSGTTTITSTTDAGYGLLNDGTFTHNDGTLILITNSNFNMRTGSSHLYDVIVNHTDASAVFREPVTIDNDLTIIAGEVKQRGAEMTVGNDYNISSDGTHSWYSGSEVYDLTVLGDFFSFGSFGETYEPTGTHSFGSLTIYDGGTFEATSGTTTINDDFYNGGTFTHNDGKINFNCTTANVTSNNNLFYDIRLSNGCSLYINDYLEPTNTMEVANGSIDNNVNFSSYAFTFDGYDVIFHQVVDAPTDLTSYLNVEQYANITKLSASGTVEINFTYSQGVIVTKNINEASLQLWKYNGGWDQSNIAGHHIDTSVNIVGATMSSVGTFYIIAPLGSATTLILGETELECNRRGAIIYCSFSAQEEDGDMVTGTSVNYTLMLINQSIIVSDLFTESSINGTYIMNYTVPSSIASEIMFIVATINGGDKSVSFPIQSSSTWQLAIIIALISLTGLFAYFAVNMSREEKPILQSMFLLLTLFFMLTTIGVGMKIADIEAQTDIYNILTGSIYTPLIIVITVLLFYFVVVKFIKDYLLEIKWKRKVR